MTRDQVTVYDCATCGTPIYYLNGQWIHFSPAQRDTHPTVVVAVVMFTRRDVA